jgi:hypothetical protein
MGLYAKSSRNDCQAAERVSGSLYWYGKTEPALVSSVFLYIKCSLQNMGKFKVLIKPDL